MVDAWYCTFVLSMILSRRYNYAKTVMKQLFFSLLLICGIVLQLEGQSTIWPGDVNNNGVVNSIDALHWAFAKGSIGEERPNASLFWEEQDLGTPWSNIFPEGINYAYADCNGDGVVDILDFIILDLNEDEEQGIYQGETSVLGPEEMAAVVWLGDELSEDTISLVIGSEINVPIYLGNGQDVIGNFFGISFLIHVDTAQIGNNFGLNFTQSEEFWSNSEASILEFSPDPYQKLQDHYSIDFCFYLEENQTIASQKKIGTLQLIVIEDDLTLLPADSSIQVIVEPLRMFDGNAGDLLVSSPDTLDILMFADSTALLAKIKQDESNANEDKEPNDWMIHPNPANDIIFLNGELSNIGHIAIYSITGQCVYKQTLSQQLLEEGLTIHQLPDGYYWLFLERNDGSLQKEGFLKLSP